MRESVDMDFGVIYLILNYLLFVMYLSYPSCGIKFYQSCSRSVIRSLAIDLK